MQGGIKPLIDTNSIFKSGGHASPIKFLTIFFVIIFLAVIMLLSLPGEPIADELIHLPQIHSFISGKMILSGIVAMPPGFHFTIASVANLIDRQELWALRSINASISLICPIIFWLYLKSEKSDFPLLRTTQVLFSPIIWPFFFLLYTDLSSLLLILTGLIFAKSNHYKMAVLVCTFSLAFRQNNIFWIFLIWLIALSNNSNILDLAKGSRLSFIDFIKRIVPSLKKTLFFIIPLFVFAIFVFLNDGVAIGNKDLHQATGIYPTQVFFCLLVLWILLLPLHIHNLGAIYNFLKMHPWFIFFLSMLGLVYYVSFDISHPYNFPSDYFIRNWILHKLNDHRYWRLVTFIPIAWALLSLALTKFENPSNYWLYPVTLISLLPVHLIEQRYYIIPFVLFMLFRTPMPKNYEYLLLLWTAFLVTLVSYGIISLKIFL